MASKYEGKSLNELREDLRKRNAKLSGRKHELVERLEAYDRNDNFKDDVPMEQEYVMDVPSGEQFKDLNSETKVTTVSFEHVSVYLDGLDWVIDEKSNKLADARFVKYVRWSRRSQDCFFKAECRAEMKKSVSYIVDVRSDLNGVVQETQCECAAGMGLNAHCKHVCAILYILAKFTDNKSLITESTCTEKLQSFHHVKRKIGSPVMAKDLQLSTKDDIRFDPRPMKYRKMAGYQDYVRNVCLNFAGKGSAFPLKQLYYPANVYAPERDHDYLPEVQSEVFLEAIYSKSSELEAKTRKQGKSRVWLEERAIRLTASNVGRICKATGRTDKKSLATSFTEVRKVSTSAIKHGRKFENVAVKKYEESFGTSVSPCGLFVHPKQPYVGASPDGVVDSSTLIEVKCPKTAYRKLISHATVPYLKKSVDVLSLDRKHDYYYQVQGGPAFRISFSREVTLGPLYSRLKV